MSDPDLFKYDVRIRQRMLDAGSLTEEQVSRHLEGLPDIAHKADDMPMSQPAMTRPDHGHEALSARRRESGPVPAPGPRPAAPAAWTAPESPEAAATAAPAVAPEDEPPDDESDEEEEEDDGWEAPATDEPGPGPGPGAGGESP